MAIFSQPRIKNALLALILILALGLRVWGIQFGLPYLYHPDEPNKIEIAQRILKTGDLNPHYFLKPSFFLYLNTAAYLPYIIIAKAFGKIETIADLRAPQMIGVGIGFTPQPKTVLLGRLVTTMFGVLAVWMVFLLGARVTREPWVGLLAAFMMAISPSGVSLSRFITPDMQVVFWVCASAVASLGILEHGRKRDYFLAFLFSGLTISSKYSAAIVLVMPLAAHLIRHGPRGLLQWSFYAFCAIAPFTFVIFNPYAVLDFPSFYAGMTFEASHYATGHVGMEGNAFAWYVRYLLSVEGAVTVFAPVALGIGLWKRDRLLLFLALFPLIYFIFISSFEVRNDRTALPLMPFLFVFCAALAWMAVRTRRFSCLPPWLAKMVIGLGLIAITLPALFQDVQNSLKLTTVDSRETARLWIDDNIPERSKIFLESYSPYIDPERFEIVGSFTAIDYGIEWYRQNGVQYLVLGENMFQRFYDDPEQYSEQIGLYNKLRATYPVEKEFNDGDYQVIILRIQ